MRKWKRNKKIDFIRLCSLFLCGFFLLAGCNSSGEVAADQWQRPLETAFAATGAEFDKWYLAGWGVLPEDHYTEEILAEMGQEICRNLQIEITGNTCQTGTDSTCLLFTGIKGGSQYEVLLQKMPVQTYLIINIHSVIGEGELGKEEILLKETLGKWVTEPDVSAMIRGYLPEKYSEKQGQKILTKAMKKIDGIVVEKTVEKTYISFTRLYRGFRKKHFGGES